MTDPPDRELMARVAGGDRDAFSILMRRHEDMVFAVCLRVLGDREAALDVTQEVFLTVFRKADRYRGDAAVTTWLYRVAMNACYDQLRKRRRRPVEPLPEHHDPADTTADAAFTSVELRPAVEQALAGIPPDFRSAVVLSDIHGLGIAEIAGILGVAEGTVKSRVFRGRRLLAASLGNLREGSRHQRDDDGA